MDIFHEAIFTFLDFDHIVHFILKQNLPLTMILKLRQKKILLSKIFDKLVIFAKKLTTEKA